MTLGSVILEKKFYKIRLPGTNDQLKSHSRNRAVGSLQFKRSAYNVKDNRNLVLVHYEGDETVYVPVTHGNSNKDNASEYTRTAPSVLKTIEHQVKKLLWRFIERTYLTILFRVSSKVFWMQET